MSRVDISQPDGIVVTVCTDCGRPVSTKEDFELARTELHESNVNSWCGEALALAVKLNYPKPGWMSAICWFPSESIDKTCRRKPQWASDLRISLARTLFSFYVGDH